jgi:GNAT superfamily N-acetyltransferase
VIIRKLTIRDQERLTELLQQLWPNHSLDPGALSKLFRRYTQEEDYGIYGYEDDRTLVGIITVSFRWALFFQGRVAIIEDLFVDRAYRHKGMGRKLVAHVEGLISRDSTVKAIEVNTDFPREEAQAFWERCGYSRMAFQFRKRIDRGPGH